MKIEFCIKEWSTGYCEHASYYEKYNKDSRDIFRTGIDEWAALNPTVTLNVRKKLSTRCLYVFFSFVFCVLQYTDEYLAGGAGPLISTNHQVA